VFGRKLPDPGQPPEWPSFQSQGVRDRELLHFPDKLRIEGDEADLMNRIGAIARRREYESLAGQALVER
jgi:hypothetical protein